MMADERLDEMAAIAEMRKELEENGYRIGVQGMSTFNAEYAFAIGPDGSRFYLPSDGYTGKIKIDDFIIMVHNHLERQRQHAALLELVSEMAECFKYDTEKLEAFVDRARELVQGK